MGLGALVVWSSLLTAAVEWGVAAYLWRRRESIRAGGLFAVAVGLAALNPVLYLLQLTAGDVGAAVRWRQLSGIAGIGTVLVVFAFGAVYTYRRWVLRSRAFYALVAALAGAALVRTTNALPGWPGVHALWARDVRVAGVDGALTLSWVPGPAYWPYLLAVAVVQLASLVLVVEFALRPEQRAYRRRNVALAVALAVPVAASIGEPVVDYPFLLRGPGALVGILVLVVALFRFGVFDAVPVTRAGVVGEFDDGVVVFDTRGRVVDVNDRGRRLLDVEGTAVGRPVRPLLADRLAGFDADGPDLGTQLADATFAVAGGDRYVETRVSTVTDADGRPVSRALVLYDVTDRERRRRELRSERDARRGIQRSLVEGSSLRGFARSACSELAVLEDVAFAWVGTGDGGDSLDPLATAETDGYPDGTLDADRSSDPPPEVAALRRDETVHRPVDPADGRWARVAADDGAAAVIAVPVEHDGVTRGVLGVHLARPAAREDGRVREVATAAADMVGHALGAAERRRALAADDRVEVTVRVDAADPLSAATADAGTTATVTGAVPRDDGTVVTHFRVSGSGADHLADRLRSAPGVAAVTGVGDGSDGTTLQAVLDGPTPRTVLAEHGGTVTEERVTPGGRRLTVRFPRGTDFDPVVAALEDRVGPASVVDYRSHTDPTDDERTPLTAATDRQREVLEAAYRAGYFDYPREQTATDLADSLDVSRPTLQEVLRAAERNVFEALFEEE